MVSTDGLLGREAKIVLQHLSQKIADKSGVSYSVVQGQQVTARISIAIARTTNRSLRGSRVPTSQMSSRWLPRWDGWAGLALR